MVFGNDGRFAVVAGERVLVWDVRTGVRVAEISDPGVRYASFSRGGAFLATAGSADEIRVWRLSAPAAPVLRHPLNNQHPHGGLAWDPGAPALRYLEGGIPQKLFVWEEPRLDRADFDITFNWDSETPEGFHPPKITLEGISSADRNGPAVAVVENGDVVIDQGVFKFA